MANAKKIDCVILGLLSHEALTGYDIKNRMDTTLRMFWGASYGSIYPTLNSMMKEELIVGENISTNGREKIQYTITEKGHQYLVQWLNKEVEKDELRYETLLKVFFGRECGVEVTIHHIEAFEKKITEELQSLQMMEKVLEGLNTTDQTHIYYLLTAKFGVQTYRGYLQWCKEAKKLLRTIEKKE
ncbi:PadR family transcriptional regulator [Anaerosporobacter faecicola]|uniref:PadR family transcriptional regulator n=1 Tax=Anaerosporobacter faecicola TaxID=2718714 RepID=UPI00143C1688|nr:PadR family transcriptional regulator [Anaerosporobacter faecicola]